MKRIILGCTLCWMIGSAPYMTLTAVAQEMKLPQIGIEGTYFGGWGQVQTEAVTIVSMDVDAPTGKYFYITEMCAFNIAANDVRASIAVGIPGVGQLQPANGAFYFIFTPQGAREEQCINGMPLAVAGAGDEIECNGTGIGGSAKDILCFARGVLTDGVLKKK